MKKTIALAITLTLLTGCASSSVQDQIQASSEGRALERIADNLSTKASSGHCSIIRTGGMFSASETVSVSCP